MSQTGRPVRVLTRKWGDQPHWEFDTVRLGTDRHGSWLGIPAGTRLARPGASYVSDRPQVTLVPDGEPFVASFCEPGGSSFFQTYVDITTVPVWEGDRVTMVDLDLDVIRRWDGHVWVDDEDEFDDHRARWGYPEDVVATALASTASVRAAVAAREAPYDDATTRRWLAALTPSGAERR